MGYFLCLLATVVVLCGDFLLKRAADQGASTFSPEAFAGYLCYGLSGVGFLLVLRNITLGQMGVAFSMISLLATVAIGVAFFGEKLQVREYLGIGLAVLSMGLMARMA